MPLGKSIMVGLFSCDGFNESAGENDLGETFFDRKTVNDGTDYRGLIATSEFKRKQFVSIQRRNYRQ